VWETGSGGTTVGLWLGVDCTAGWVQVTHGGGVCDSRDREREPRVRVRESPARLRESSDLTATSVGDWEWGHDGGTLAGSGLHGRLGSSVQVTHEGGGVCEWSVGSVCECEPFRLLLLFLFCY
jgi:hypothetical protein